MGVFDAYLYKYGLHNCVINGISIKKNTFLFRFNEGVNLLDKGMETDKTTTCLICFELTDLNVDKILEYIAITKIAKKRVYYDVPFKDLVKDVKKNGFDVIMNYCSSFNQCILIEGYTMEATYQIVISGIKNIEFIF